MHQQRPNAAKVSKIIFFKLIHIKKKKNLRKAKTKTPTDKRCPEEQTGTSGNESDAGNTAVLENGRDFYHSLKTPTMSRLTIGLVRLYSYEAI